MKQYIAIFCALSVLILSGCSSAKKVPYMQEIETIPAEALMVTSEASDPRLAPGDLLNILVTSTNMQAALPFNKGKYITSEGLINNINNNYNTNSQLTAESNTDTYLINAQGDIEFPILGKIHVAGLTKTQLADKLQAMIYPAYMKEKPAIDIRVANFRVTVLGEVNKPGVVSAPNERLNILEAIAMSGDLGIKGRRDNVLIIRTNYDGTREVARVDLQDKNLILSPYFWLQQNDQIYVEPNKSAANASWQLAPGVSAAITFVGGISSLASLVIGIINLSK